MKLKAISGMALAFVLAACGGNSQPSEGPVHSVMLTQPEGGSAVGQKTFSAQVEEGREVNVGFRTGGQIARLLVKEGDYVHQGQLIATLDTKDYQLGLDNAQIQYDQMKRQVARMKKLYEAKSLSGNDYDKAVSGLEQLEVQLKNNQNQLSYTRLTSPVSGYVQSVNMESGEMTGAGTPVISVLDVSQMEVTTNIPTSLYLQKDKITGWTCKGAFTDNQEVAVKLISYAPKADNSQLYKVRLALPAQSLKKVTSGMNAEIRVDLNQSSEAANMTLPLSAVFNQDGKDYVWVFNAKDSTVNQTPVTVSNMNAEGKAIITDGLKGDEQVVKAGVNVLTQKEKVRVIAAPSKTNVGGLI